MIKLYYRLAYTAKGKSILYSHLKCNTYDCVSKCYQFCKRDNVVINRIEGDEESVKTFQTKYVTEFNTLRLRKIERRKVCI